MCLWVCRGLPHLHVTFFSGKNCLQNSPMYVWPVQHCIRRPKNSCWSLSSVKCFVGLRDGGILFEIVNHPFFGVFCHLQAHAACMVALACHRANALDVPIGAFHAICVASFASSSALSLPCILQWLGHQLISIVHVVLLLRNLAILW